MIPLENGCVRLLALVFKQVMRYPDSQQKTKATLAAANAGYQIEL